MKKIRIHRVDNVLWGRNHREYFLLFVEYLKKYFDVEYINYADKEDQGVATINLLKPVSSFGKTPPLSDVDLVIENMDTGEIKVLSVTEYFNSYVSHYAKSESCTKVLLSHFNWSHLYYWMKRENAVDHIYKVKPWIFLLYQDFDVDFYRIHRDKQENFSEKFFWKGSGVADYRKVIMEISKLGYMQSTDSVEFSTYLEQMSESLLGLSFYQTLDRYRTPFDYPGEMCYRDVEYMSVGLPFVRIEYRDTLSDPLIQNHHYISIQREDAYSAYEKDGDLGVAKLYVEKYQEFSKETNFLRYISKNQREWYDRNISPNTTFKLTFDLLELEKWI